MVGWIPDSSALYLFSGPRLTWPLTVQQLGAMDAGEGFTAWMMVDEDASEVGHFDLTVSQRVARLGRVLVAPERRGQGAGRELVTLAIETARMLGADELRLNVIADNAPAVRTYEAAGFRALPPGDRPDVRPMSLPL